MKDCLNFEEMIIDKMLLKSEEKIQNKQEKIVQEKIYKKTCDSLKIIGKEIYEKIYKSDKFKVFFKIFLKIGTF